MSRGTYSSALVVAVLLGLLCLAPIYNPPPAPAPAPDTGKVMGVCRFTDSGIDFASGIIDPAGFTKNMIGSYTLAYLAAEPDGNMGASVVPTSADAKFLSADIATNQVSVGSYAADGNPTDPVGSVTVTLFRK